MKSLTVVLLAVVVQGTAHPQDAPPYRTVVRTSGDTTIARTTGDVPNSRLKRLVLEWQASADLSDGALSIGDIRNMTVGPDGRVYVWDPTTPALWLIDANGKTLKRVSRQGAGPGEYAKDHNGIVIATDGRLKMWDEGNARINIYDADGRFLSSHALGFSFCCPGSAITADVQNRLWLRTVVGATDDKPKSGGRPPSISDEVTAYVRTNAAGVVTDTLITRVLSGNSQAVTASGPNGTSSSTVPYSTVMLYAVSPLGHVVFGQGRPYVVHSTHNGKPLRIERDWTPVPIANDERAQIRARLEFSMRRMNPSWTWNGAPVPSDKPAYSNISVAQDGRIWVSLNVPSEAFTPDPPTAPSLGPRAPPVTFRPKERRWDVFERDGRYLGRIVAPRAFGLHVMKGNHVWGVVRDENDVPTVVKMRIEPGM